jgi:hypothetical protein
MHCEVNSPYKGRLALVAAPVLWAGLVTIMIAAMLLGAVALWGLMWGP